MTRSHGLFFCADSLTKVAMKIAILGAHGRLGRMLAKAYPGALALGRDRADLTRPTELRRTLINLAPHIVLNAAALTQVDRAETEESLAFAINATGVYELAAICRDLDAVLIHFSTNYVFGADPSRSVPYVEEDAPGPINVYGKSKLAGEMFVRDLCPRHFILRTCGLHGALAGQSDFVELMLRKAREGAPIRVVDDQTCTPTSLAEVASAVAPLSTSSEYGVYHLTNGGACTWHEFARRIFEITRMTATLIPVKSAEFAAPAARPHYSVLDCSRWKAKGFPPLRSWQDALEATLAGR
jgi:dTDP-4-dehydrorhamnose reductase